MTKIPYQSNKSVLWNAANRHIIYINRIEIMPEGTKVYSLNVHQYLDPEQAKDELIGIYESFITGHLLYKVEPFFVAVHNLVLSVVKMQRFKPFQDLKEAVIIAINGIMEIEA